MFETKTHTESVEVSTELKLGCGSYITKKRTANENLANSSLPATSSGNKRMKLDGHQVEKGEGPIGFDPWVIKKRITDSEIQGGGRLRLPVIGVSIHSSYGIIYAILPHQRPTLLFYHIILQHSIY